MPRNWKIWLDVNISPIIAKWMVDELNLSAQSAYTLGFYDKSDLEIYEIAKAAGNIILISKDTDFPELITRLGSPPKLININIGNCDNRYLWSRLNPHLYDLIEKLSSMDINIIDFH